MTHEQVNKEAEATARKIYDAMIDTVFKRKHWIFNDGKRLTRSGRLVLYYLAQMIVSNLNRQGDEHHGKLDTDEFPTGYTMISWLLGQLMRIRKGHPKKEKPESHVFER